MGLTYIRERAEYAGKNTDNFEIAALAKAILLLCDRVEGLETSHTISMNQIEVDERLGRSS